MYVLETNGRFLNDGNATEASTVGGNAAASSAPIAPTAFGENPSRVPTTPSPTAGISPVALPTSITTIEEPASAPITKDLPPISAPASPPIAERFPTRLTDPPYPTKSGSGKAQSTPYSSSTPQDIDSFLLNPFHIIVIACIVGAITLLLFCKCCKSFKLRREKQMLRLQSTRVDAVLGDMQMVGMDEYDEDDPELI